jgi:hypothetical protein
VDDTLAAMIENCDGFPEEMATELTAWQVEDMHRRYPNTDLKEDTVETDIWPRSRAQETDKKKIREAIKRPRIFRTHSPGIKGIKGTSNRPILRPSLYDMLVERMTALMERCLSWR